MDKSKKASSQIVIVSNLDVKDELDERLEKAYSVILGMTTGLSERDANDAIQQYASKGPQCYEDVQFGLFYTILTDPKNATKAYRDMALVSRDGLTKVLTVTNQLLYEKWIKLQDSARTQILWFSKELVKNNMNGADSVCHSLIRQIAGGDVSPKNIWLAEAVLDIFVDNRSWLEKFGWLLAMSLYTYLRIIVDHNSQAFSTLRQREVDFCVSLMKEKWNDCMVIGRDLARLLQNVARIPEFDKLWKDILHNPTALNPTFTGLPQLMQIRTSKRYFASRLTPDMENKLVFLTSKVRFGQQKRYQDWFQRQYLSTPESQSLRCDLIRYICAVIHPSNELLCSDIIPRWAVIGWLLTTCTSNVAASNAKLSLFYDWLFFDKERDSIMNIEPCILVMYHSMKPHPAITATLLDFMCRIMTHFYPPLASHIKAGIYSSLKTILEKRVLQSLSPLFDNPKLDKELRSMIRENFAEFCSIDVPKEEPSVNNNKDLMEIDSSNSITDSGNIIINDIAEFSDEEDDIPVDKLQSEHVKFQPIKESPKFETIDISEHVEHLDGNIKACVIDLQNESDNELQCEMVDRLVQTVIRESSGDVEFDENVATPLAQCLCLLLKAHLNSLLFPKEIDDESIEDSIGTPVFVIFRNICATPDEDPCRQPLLLLLEEMYKLQPRIGYYFLYFLKVSKVQHDEKMSAYKDFCQNMESNDVKACLMSDLRLCQEEDVRLFAYLIPDIYTQFPNIAIGNAALLHLIVSCIDSSQLQDLVCEIFQAHLIMFRKDSFLSVLNASLEWETIEQYFLWQLIAAHNIPTEHLMPILPKLEFVTHAEAMTSIMIQLKQDCPSADLIRPLLCRSCKMNDLFTVSVLKHWAQEYEDKLADLLLAQLTKCNSTPNRKRKQNVGSKSKEKDQPSVEQVLSHLDHMRQTCRNISFLTHESIQEALQKIQLTCTDAQKARYGDLLALAEDFEDVKTTRVLRAVPSRRASAAAASAKSNNSNSKLKKLAEESETSEESSEDEEIVKPPKNKKAKKSAVVFESD